MIEIFESKKARFSQSLEKLRRTYRHEAVEELPVVINDVNGYLSGETPSLIPEDYFENYKVMADFQIKKIADHLERYDDDYIPVLLPWYGTGVVPSALGCRTVFQDKLDPAVEGTVIKEPGDIQKLQLPDPYKDGLMPRVLACIDFMKGYSDIPVSITDCQGPLNIAICLCGAENLFVWMYEYPEQVHEIMDFSTEALIRWVKVQKKHAGHSLDSGAYPHCIALPEGFGGVNISDDDCTVISPALYEEFVVPYNSRVFEAFGGGTLHYCGSAEHQFENFLKTRGLTGINNFCMGDFKQLFKLQEACRDKAAVMACDFAPYDIKEYYRGLMEGLQTKGAILSPFVVPEFALANRSYINVSRDRHEVAAEILSTIRKFVAGRKCEA